ncbi:hypothetical protein EIT86_23570 [Salmonella enterica]|nr:hypothetical protein [Salmonella enterica]
MWKTLHQLAAPPRLYQICGRLVPWLAAAGIIALATGWVRGFGFAPAMRSPLRWAIAGFLLLFMTLALMRMRNLILLMEKRRPWVSELILKRGHR